MARPVVERYLELGLQLGRHDDSVVDAYFGPAELAAAVESAPLPEPPALVAAADALLEDLDDSWLRDQVVGLRTFAGVLAGESRSYADEVEGCFGLRPTRTDESVFAAAHKELDELLPGTGPLDVRLHAWRDSILVPADKIEAVVSAVIPEARRWTQELVELPAGEDIELEIVHDESWNAYNGYLGDLRGRISVNVDIPLSALDLLHLTLHETYPGHQAERACKDELLVRGQGMLEESLVLGPTPQSLISEGIAEAAPALLLEGAAGTELAKVVRDAGVPFDLEHALAVERARQPCRWAEINTALLLHGDGASEADARAYLERWGVLTPELVVHLIRFITDPESRTYIFNYPAGRELCAGYLAGDPERYRRLVTEQLRVRDLVTVGGG